MLALLLSICVACSPPQGPRFSSASAVPVQSAVSVQGDTELTPAAAFASAEARVDEHVRTIWQQRVEREVVRRRPFWLPELLADEAMRRWLSDLPVERLVKMVDREDRERTHEFGNSYQTTLWIAEDPGAVETGERRLRDALRRLEQWTAVKYGGIAAGWLLLALMLGWLDRLSRGYMTGRLRAIGLLGGLAMPAIAFLV